MTFPDPVGNNAALPELIPLRVLFGSNNKSNPHVSPSGKLCGYIADAPNGVANVFIKSIAFASTDNSSSGEAALVDTEAFQVTNETQRPIRQFTWSKALAQPRLFFAVDDQGDENFHLHVAEFAFDEATNRVHDVHTRDLTPFKGCNMKFHSLVTSKSHPDVVFVELNKRDPHKFDMCRIDLLTGEVTIEIENPGSVADWLVNANFHVWGCAEVSDVDGSVSICVRPSLENTNAGSWRTIAVWPHGETADVYMFSKDTSGLYVQTSISHGEGATEVSDTTRLVLLSTVDGSELQVIAHDPKCDVDSVEFSANACVPQFAVFNYTKPRVEVLDESVRADVEHLEATCIGSFKRISVSDDELTWLYADNRDDASLKYFVFDRRSRRHALLFDSRPALNKYQLAPMTPHVIQTSDGEDMIVYVSLPLGIQPNKLPFVVSVHGGPWYRDSWGLDIKHQLFVNRGYGCISVNFRGSTGLGKRWGYLGDCEWGGKMQDDIADAAQWTIKQGLADKDRVAIYGGSFGGYSTLCGLAFKPELYACGVDIVGPSNIRTMLGTFPLYWDVMKKLLEIRIGPVTTDDAFNERISPLFHAHRIIKPLLIAQGANDPRVKQAESDQIAKKLFELKHDVQYVIYSDEGHGFARPANNIDFYSRADAFLAQYLGGRYLPADKSDTEGTTGVLVDVLAL